MTARTHSMALLGLTGAVVEIEADISPGLPMFTLIGLPDTALSNARERVRLATANAGVPVPNKKITVNLSPAALPKYGAAFDLGIALALLAADGSISAEAIERVVHLGELGLDGRLRPTSGILPAVLAGARLGYSRFMVPRANVHEAELVPGVAVVAVATVREAAIAYGAELEPIPVDAVAQGSGAAGGGARGGDSRARVGPSSDGGAAAELSAGTLGSEPLELADIVGNRDAVNALVVAAAGGHHAFFLGPPGAGKTMLAARLPGILPGLGSAEALEVLSIRSLNGEPIGDTLDVRPPFESPHHTITAAAMVGGGSKQIRPGAAARAANGVLFLDEAPEFAAAVLDTLRQPLESGTITIHRGGGTASYPGGFQLILAANPCPCGAFGSADLNECTCSPQSRRRYLARISGPLLDRIDIRVRVNRITAAELRLSSETAATTTALAQQRVLRARKRAAPRLAFLGLGRNAAVPGAALRGGALKLPLSATTAIDRALERGALTMRGYDRVLRVAWTIADLDDLESPGPDQIGRALYLRKSVLP